MSTTTTAPPPHHRTTASLQPLQEELLSAIHTKMGFLAESDGGGAATVGVPATVAAPVAETTTAPVAEPVAETTTAPVAATLTGVIEEPASANRKSHASAARLLPTQPMPMPVPMPMP